MHPLFRRYRTFIAIAIGLLINGLFSVACGSNSDTSSSAGSTQSAGGTGGTTTGVGAGAGTGGSGMGGSLLTDAGPSPFPQGNVYIAGSRNAEVFEYDSSLSLVSHWTDPHFGTVLQFPGQDFGLGPAGMAFDANGYLVVASNARRCT